MNRVLKLITVGFILSSSCLAATLTVTKTADTNDGVCDADCSLREAVSAANASAVADTILFNIPTAALGCTAGDCTITLTNGELIVNSAITAGLLSIQNTNGTRDNLVISGNNNSRIFNIAAGGNLTIDGITFTRGKTFLAFAHGGAIINQGNLRLLNSAVTASSVSANTSGGGLANLGEMTVENTTISGNFSGGTGGGLLNNSSLSANVTNCLITGNTADIGGAGISNAGTFYLSNSTVSGNISPSIYSGGGIFNASTLNVTNSTITANYTGGSGGGICNVSLLRARNTVISGNTSPGNDDVSGTLSLSESNLIGVTVPLGPLGFYGGPTRTYALLSSATNAVNRGNNCVLNQSCATFNALTALTTDQRGAARVGNVDIGAFEVNNSANGGTFKAVLPTGRTGTSYATTLIPTVPSGTTYAVTAGALPTGLTVGATALAGIADELTSAPQAGAGISGIPTFGGLFNFTITVNSGGNTTATDYQMLVNVPTSAGVSVEGRVTTANGRGVANAFVILTDATGQVRTVKTAALGYFRFEDVAAGQTVVLNVKSRKFSFAPKVVFLADNIAGLDLVGTP